MGNRVEDLETQVAQLQAAVDGLTEELVETKERLRQLESATDLDPSTETGAAHAEFVPNESSGSAGDEERSEEAAAEASDGANSPEHGEEADDGEEAEESDDIIVA